MLTASLCLSFRTYYGWLKKHREAPAVFQQGAAWQEAELAGVLQGPWQAQQVELFLATICSGREGQLQPPLEKTKGKSANFLNILVLTMQHLPLKSSREDQSQERVRMVPGEEHNRTKISGSKSFGEQRTWFGVAASLCS